MLCHCHFIMYGEARGFFLDKKKNVNPRKTTIFTSLYRIMELSNIVYFAFLTLK